MRRSGLTGMVHLIPAGTHLFRVTEIGRTWRDVVSGVGAYFTCGGRYNRVHQRTVYASKNALVSVAETAAHAALDNWQPRIGRGSLDLLSPLPEPVPPLVSDHLLWEFTLDVDLLLLRVDHPTALATFHHSHYVLLNPSMAYRKTADLADAIRLHPHPRAANTFVDGITARSVRFSPERGIDAMQQIIFVPANQHTIPATLIQRWRMSLEFTDKAGQSVQAKTRAIDWEKPWFRLSDNAESAQTFPSNEWHRFRVNYT